LEWCVHALFLTAIIFHSSVNFPIAPLCSSIFSSVYEGNRRKKKFSLIILHDPFSSLLLRKYSL
jgi:hypothetical protein